MRIGYIFLHAETVVPCDPVFVIWPMFFFLFFLWVSDRKEPRRPQRSEAGGLPVGPESGRGGGGQAAHQVWPAGVRHRVGVK